MVEQCSIVSGHRTRIRRHLNDEQKARAERSRAEGMAETWQENAIRQEIGRLLSKGDVVR